LQRCRELKARDPEALADILFFTIEGAQICDHVADAVTGRSRLATAMRGILAAHGFSVPRASKASRPRIHADK
jgi:hypothetical protein